MGLCLKPCPQWHNTEVLSSTKTLRDIAVWSLIKGAAFGVIWMQHIKGLHMLLYAFNMRHWRHYQGRKVLEVKSGRRDNLDDCTFNWVQQRLAVWLSALDRERGERDNGKKPKSAVASPPPQTFSPPPLPNSLRHVDLYESWHFSRQWWNHHGGIEGRPVECIHTQFLARPDTSNLPASHY